MKKLNKTAPAIITTVITLAVFSCTDTRPEKLNNEFVTVVFDNPPENSSFREMGGSIFSHTYCYFSYIGQDGFPVFLDQKEIGDTIVLATHDGLLEVAHLYKGIQLNYFLFQGGDTVTFRYDSLRHPVAVSSLTDEITKIYNWEHNIEGNSIDYGFNPVTLYQLRRPQPDPDLFNNEHAYWLQNFRSKYEEDSNNGVLDSLYAKYYNYRLQKADNTHKYFELALKEGLTYANNHFRTTLAHKDSLGRFISYYHGLVVGYPFEEMITAEHIPPQSRMLGLYSILRSWSKPSLGRKPQYFIDTKIAEYYSATGDSTVIERLNAEFGMFGKVPSNVDYTDMVLLDPDSTAITLADLRQRLKGKVLYMDMWASWCGPCIENLPHSKLLEKEYEGKDVEFIYLAYNDKFDRWINSLSTYDMRGQGHNYFIVDASKTDLVKKLHIPSIPRYVVFDRDGNIAVPDSPEPGSREIREVLDKYLM